MNAALQPRRTRAARRRAPSKPLERDAELPLLKLEHAITSLLAVRGRLEHCAELSAFLDGVHQHERLDALCVIGGVK